ncbi:MAG: hypothetical protein ABR991_06800, partial [Terracidiphilus sp.]
KAGAWNLVLNAQGRIQGDLHVWREGEALELEIAADQYEKLLAHLDRFIIMDDVELAPLDGITALGLTGPLAGELLVRLGLTAAPTIDVERKEVSVESHPSDKNKCVARVGHPIEPMTSERAAWNGAEVLVVRGYGELAQHFELWIQAAEVAKMWEALIGAGARPVGADSLEAFRIAEGIPAYGVDIAERDLPQETSQMRALCFNKGCYLGQEIVERIRSRGSVHRHLRPLELFGTVPAAGAALTWEGGAIAGSITSAAEVPLAAGSRLFALGMIRGEAELRSQPLYYTAGEVVGTARILTAPPGLKAG